GASPPGLQLARRASAPGGARLRRGLPRGARGAPRRRGTLDAPTSLADLPVHQATPAVVRFCLHEPLSARIAEIARSLGLDVVSSRSARTDFLLGFLR